jgi:predicted nucleotidyltransferase
LAAASDKGLLAALRLANAILTGAGVPHALLGGVAANLYRKQPRATQDVDFAVRADRAATEKLLAAFEAAGWKPVTRWDKHEAIRLTAAGLPRVDLLLAGTPFEESALARAAQLSIDGIEMRIVRPEDLIVYKLLAGRPHDYEAAGAILQAIDGIDEAYVVGWLEQFGLEQRWEAALAEARRIAEDE